MNVIPSTTSWGFQAGDLFSNAVNLVHSAGGFILLFLVLLFSPKLITFIKGAIDNRRDQRNYSERERRDRIGSIQRAGAEKVKYDWTGQKLTYQFTDAYGTDIYYDKVGNYHKGNQVDFFNRMHKEGKL